MKESISSQKFYIKPIAGRLILFVLLWSGLFSFSGCSDVELCSGLDLSPDCQPAIFLTQFIGENRYGSHLYLTSTGVQGFQINQDSGMLTELTSSPFGTACTKAIKITSDQNFLYFADDTSKLYSIGLTSPESLGSSVQVFTTFSFVDDPVFSSNGKHTFLIGDSSENIISANYDNSTGSITAVSGSPFGSGCYSSLQQVGNFLFASESHPSVASSFYRSFSYSETDGSLTLMHSSSIERKINDQVKHPEKDIVYASNAYSAIESVFAFELNTIDGSFTELTGSPFSYTASNKYQSILAIHPEGTYLYLYSSTDAGLKVFEIDSATGALSYLATHDLNIANNINDLIVDPSGKYLYLTNSGVKEIWVISIDSSTGMLMQLTDSTVSTGVDTPTSLELYTATIPW